jgi:hypothetical protein
MNSSTHTTDWLPGVWALLASVLAAVLYLALSKRRANDIVEPNTLDDFDARYQSQLAQLKEHLANRHLHSAEHFESEKQRLEQAAAATLKARAERQHEDTKRQARQEKLSQVTAAPQQSWLKGALVGGGLVAFFGFLGLQLSQTAQVQPDSMRPAPNAGAPMQPPADSKLEALAARVQTRSLRRANVRGNDFHGTQ